MISFGCDYCWTIHSSHFDHKERGLNVDRYTFLMYLCYLTYAPLYIAGPIVGYNAFAAQLEVPQKNYSFTQISWYGLRWILSFLLMEGMTHFFHYNSFVVRYLFFSSYYTANSLFLSNVNTIFWNLNWLNILMTADCGRSYPHLRSSSSVMGC